MARAVVGGVTDSEKSPKRRRWGVVAMRRAVFGWAALFVLLLGYLGARVIRPGQGDWILAVACVFLVVSAPVAATSAVVYGHMARGWGERSAEAELERTRGRAAVALGYLWWFVVCLIFGWAVRGMMWFGYVVALMELPRIIVEKAGGRLWAPLGWVLLLGAVTCLALLETHGHALAPAWVGTLELVVLAAWWPFSPRTAASNRNRILVGLLLYVFAALAVLGAWMQLRSFGFR